MDALEKSRPAAVPAGDNNNMPRGEISKEDYERFCRYLETASGITLGANKGYLISSRLNRIMDEAAVPSLGALVDTLNKGGSPSLKVKVIDAMTTNETLWFRDSEGNHPAGTERSASATDTDLVYGLLIRSGTLFNQHGDFGISAESSGRSAGSVADRRDRHFREHAEAGPRRTV